MKETTPAAMPPCFEKWCGRFDEAFTHKAQKKGFRHYLGGVAKNRKITINISEDTQQTIRIVVLPNSSISTMPLVAVLPVSLMG